MKTMRNLWAVVMLLVAVLGLLVGPTANAALIGEWTFNNDTADDTSGNGNDGVISGGHEFRNATNGRGLYLDGISGMVNFGDLPYADVVAGTPFTGAAAVEAWFSVADQGAGGLGQGGPAAEYYQIAGKEIRKLVGADASRDQDYVGMAIWHRDTPDPAGEGTGDAGDEVQDSGRWIGHSYFGSGGGGATIKQTDIGNAGLETEWHYIVQQQQGEGIHRFVNGEKSGGGGSAPMNMPESMGDFVAGFNSEGGNFTEMVVNQIRLWDNLLSDADASAAYAAGPIPEPATLGLLGIGGLLMVIRRKR